MQQLGHFLIHCLLFPFSRLPLKWSHKLGASLGLVLIHYNRKRFHIARCNLHQCFPEKSADEINELLRQTAEESGKWFMESAYVWFRNPAFLRKKITVSNEDLLKQAYEQQRGVVIILPHIGNWEIFNFYMTEHYDFGAMYKPIKSSFFEQLIFKQRTRLGSQMFATNVKGVRQAFKAIKKNTAIAILSDHLPSRDAGVYAPFFNYPVVTGKFTQSLSNLNQSPTLLASVLRKADGKGFEIVFDTAEGLHTEDTLAAATALNQAIEKSIKLAPAQYQWVYRRFAHPPEGVKSIYERES